MSNQEQDVPISVAVFISFCVAAAWIYLNYLRFAPEKIAHLGSWASEHQVLIWTSVIAASINLAIVGSFVRRTVGLQRQGSRLKKLEGTDKWILPKVSDSIAIAVGTAWFFGSREIIGRTVSALEMLSPNLELKVKLAVGLNLALCLSLLVGVAVRRLPSMKRSSSPSLSPAPYAPNRLVLGTCEVQE